MRIGRVTSKGAVKVLSTHGTEGSVSEKDTEGEISFNYTALRKSGNGTPNSVLEKLIFVWFLCFLGGCHVGDALRTGRVKEPKTTTNPARLFKKKAKILTSTSTASLSTLMRD